jgi:hypothetical protein
MTHARDAARETEERFVRAIADHVPVERVAEVYLFPPLRQGAIESGVAVVAVTDAMYDVAPVGDAPVPDASVALAQGTELFTPGESPNVGDRLEDGPEHGERVVATADRHVVYTATYRHTRKGPDRGAWSVEVVAQADAPLDAVAAAVRGVHRRAGEGDGAEAERMSGSQFRALMAGAPPAEPTTPIETVASSSATIPDAERYAADAAAGERGGDADTGSSISSGGGGDGTA